MNANLKGSAGIAIGNVVGSNIANILMVIGVTACIATIPAVSKGLTRDLVMMILVSVWMTIMMIMGEIDRITGLLMVVALLTYIAYQYRQTLKGEMEPEEVEEPEFSNIYAAFFFLLIGFAGVALGAEYLVRGSIIVAQVMEVPEAVIGLSIIAFGTCLPELSTCVIAAMKKHADIVLGNIVGSNVFNVLMIIGTTTAIKPIQSGTIAPQVVQFDIWIMLAVSVIFAAFILTMKRIPMFMGYVFSSLYVAYIIGLYYLYM